MSGGHKVHFANLPSRKSGTRAVVFVLQQSLPEKVYINAISRSWADYPPHLVYVTGVVRPSGRRILP